MDQIQKYALLLLKTILESDAIDAFSSLSLAQIQRSVGDSAKTDRMTKKYLDELEQYGYLRRGAMEGHSLTWFITQNGKDLLFSI